MAARFRALTTVRGPGPGAIVCGNAGRTFATNRPSRSSRSSSPTGPPTTGSDTNKTLDVAANVPNLVRTYVGLQANIGV
jgi:hypothetical protein